MQNIGSDLIRGNIDTIILKTMLDGDKYGLDIIKEVESRSNGTYELKQPTLYSCLKRLENQELISSYWLDSDIGGRRHYYKLTEKGRDFYNKKQEEWAKSKFIIDNLLSNYNYEEYRLVKKDDYDKIIENKQPDYNNQSPLSDTQVEDEENLDEIDENEVVVESVNVEPKEDENEIESEDELDVDLNDNLEDSEMHGDKDFETTNLESDIEDFNNIEENQEETINNSPADTQKSERKYFVNLEDEENEDVQVASYEEKDYSASESNILSILRKQDDEINTYVGDQHSYINHLNQTEEESQEEFENLDEIEDFDEVEDLDEDDSYNEPENLDDAIVVQDSLLDLADNNDATLENKINEFEEAIEELNNFDSSLVEEDDVEFEGLTYEELENDTTHDDSYYDEQVDDSFVQKSVYSDEVYTEPEEQDHIDFDSNSTTYSNAFESVKEPTKCACEYVDDFDDLNELNNQNNSSFLSSLEDVAYNNVQITKHYTPDDLYTSDNNLTDSSDASFDFDNEEDSIDEIFPTVDSISDDSWNDVYGPLNLDEETDEESVEEPVEEPVSFDTNTYANENESLSSYSIDDIISKNMTSTREDITSSYKQTDVFSPTYTSSNYKEKLSNLSMYSKVTPEEKPVTETEATRKAKDISALKNELEEEGIKIKEYKKYGSNEQAEKSYLLVNKINLINSLILLFGYVFILSAVYIILNNTAFKDTFGFNFKYFVFGFIPFIAIALYHGIKFIINPYKKVPAKYAPRIMIFISVIITIQLLLITYCVNLQLGFYSFTQSGYNHLIWLVPTIVSFAPVLYTTVYMALFYSKNFNI